MNRRDALIGFGVGAAGMLSKLGALPDWASQPASISAFEPDVDIALVAAPESMSIRAGARTRVWRFSGSVLHGPSNAVQPLGNSYLGPTLRFKRGQKVRIRFRNNLPEPTIVHWHGLDVPEAADGHPRLAIAPGAEYIYEFEVRNRAGTYFYHPHPHGATGKQVYRGLAGMLIVSDDEERALHLPDGDEELVCVLQDRTFDADNQLVYLAGGMMDQMHGSLGTTMLVNGRERVTLELETKAYRLRLLNGSSSRVFKLTWDDGTPMTAIGVDGGLLAAPVEQQFLTLAPAERADVILDLSQHALGRMVQLRSAPFPGAEVSIEEGGMRGRMGGRGAAAGDTVANGESLLLMSLRVARRVPSSFRMPPRLAEYGAAWQEKTDAPVRKLDLNFRAGQWLLGGRSFEMLEVASDEIVRAGSTQIWEVRNAGGMMGQQMAHPLHVHGTQFRILSRERAAGIPASALSVRHGIVDDGWHDTVLILPNETVRLQLQFTSFPGLYLYHCHILEHEDAGMMRNLRIIA